MIKVSVVIPVYNTEKYVESCLASVSGQSYPNLEIIVVEDKSTDDSLRKVREFADANPDADIKIVLHDVNKGLAEVRNTGIRNASGDYLFFIDSDDFIPPWSIAFLVETLHRHPLSKVVYGSRYEFGDGADFPMPPAPQDCRERYFDDRVAIKKMILSERCRPLQFATNMLINRKWLIDNRLFYPAGLLNEDFYWSFFAAKCLDCMTVSEGVTYFYRYNPAGIMATFTKRRYADNLKIIICRFARNLDSVCLGAQLFLILRKIHTYCVYKYDLLGRSVIVRGLFTALCTPCFLVNILFGRR